MDPNMLSESSKTSKIMPKIKSSAGEEPLEWRKSTIERKKTHKNSEKTKYRRHKE